MNPNPARASSRFVLLAGGAIVLAAAVAYHRTLSGPFVFDDVPSILDNPSLKSFLTAWSPPRGFGFTVSGRPVLNASLALNYTIGGTQVWSYHAFNLLVHALAGLTLFGLIRRTLLRPELAEMFSSRALPVAFVAALVWTLHPLQTEAVTYVIQRAESLMGLFFLLTLYGWVRALESSRPRGWFIFSVVACLLGLGCKEVMVAAPLVVLLYDRTFGAGSFSAAWQRHRWPLLALFATWLPLAWLVLSTGGDRGGTFALTPAAFGDYWLAQVVAVVHYLRLSVWPEPLIFEYGRYHVTRVTEILMPAALLLVLAGGTLWALWRRPALGFLGASFFLILAPTSLLPGVTQTIVEHRMYLPLAALAGLLAGLLAGAGAYINRHWVWAGGLVLALGLGVLTLRRNEVYQSKQRLWEDTVAKRPQSAIAQSNLGTVYYELNRWEDARVHYELALKLDPASAQAYYNLGLALDRLGRPAEALGYYQEAVKLLPYFAQAQVKLASDLIRLGRAAEAFGPLKIALSYIPDFAEGHYQLGLARLESGQPDLAQAAFARALQLNPDYADAECNLGVAWLQLNRPEEARRHLERALALQPASADAHYNLGLIEAAAGHADKAEAHYAESVRLNPTLAEARLNWAITLAQRDNLPGARAQLEETIRQKPALAEAHNNLGLILAAQGETDAARREFTEALRLRPDYAQAHYNLGDAMLRLGQLAEAKKHFAEALRLRPDFAAARDMLERLP